MLQRGTPKLGKDGKPMKDKRGKVIYEPYQIRVLNTINFKKSMHYNPFAYLHSEKDILKLVTTLIANTKGEGKAGTISGSRRRRFCTAPSSGISTTRPRQRNRTSPPSSR